MASDAVPCHFCHFPTPMESGDSLAIWTQCPRCGARGPVIDKTRADASAQATAGWNSPLSRLGNLAIAKVPGGLPAATISLGERMKLIGEAVCRGDHGAPISAVFLLRGSKEVIVSPHNMSPGDIVATLSAIRDAASIRAGAVSLPSRPR